MAVMPFERGFRVVSPFGRRTDPITGEENVWHGGVDLVGLDPETRPPVIRPPVIRAAAGGLVLRSRMADDDGSGDRTWEWGNYVSVLGDDGCVIYYCHLAERLVKAGDRIGAGEALGIEGSTGRSTGPHLHFEVRRGGVQTDPCAYLGIPNEAGFVWTPVPAETEGPRTDAPWLEQASPWAAEAVDWAVRAGILLGRGGDDYALREFVTREELCVMLGRMGLSGEGKGTVT